MKRLLYDVLASHLLWRESFGRSGSRADLYGANLYGADLSRADLYVIHAPRWTIIVQPDLIGIGCKKHTPDEWWNFTDDQIKSMHPAALVWWKKHKHLCVAAHKCLIEEVAE